MLTSLIAGHAIQTALSGIAIYDFFPEWRSSGYYFRTAQIKRKK
jgi:hypothetical protein